MTIAVQLPSPDKSHRRGRAPQALSHAFEQLFSLSRAGAAEVLLVRHAEPDYDVLREDESSLDPPLSAIGREQSMLLAARLEGSAINAVYASATRASAETAAYTAAAHGLPVARVEGLGDVLFNPRKIEQLDDGGPSLEGDIARRFLAEPRWDSLPGFEPSRAFRHRAIQAVDAIVARHPGECVVVVSHSSVINAYLSMLLGIPRDLFFLPNHASISTIRSSGDLYAIAQLNDVAHVSPSLRSY